MLGGLIALAGVGCRTKSEPSQATEARKEIIVGAKNFQESRILQELVAQQLERSGFKDVIRDKTARGTLASHYALAAGSIDVYVEYTGTAYCTILTTLDEDWPHDPCGSKAPRPTPEETWKQVDSVYQKLWHLRWGPSLGFDNPFALLIRRRMAQRDSMRTISDAASRRDWQIAFSYEFAGRPDGYGGLTRWYGLKPDWPARVMGLDETYQQLHDGQVNLIVGNATDGQIVNLNLYRLIDNKHYFPPYEAAPVVRDASLESHPGMWDALRGLGGTVDATSMRLLNCTVDVEKTPIKEVVRSFLDGAPEKSQACQRTE